MTMAVTTYRYRSLRTDEPLRTKLVELAREKPRFGYRRLQVLLQRSGEHVNHKRLHRVYREAGLAIRPSVITSKAANGYHFKTGQRDWSSRTENVLTCRLLWWQVGFGAPAPRAALEHVSVVQ